MCESCVPEHESLQESVENMRSVSHQSYILRGGREGWEGGREGGRKEGRGGRVEDNYLTKCVTCKSHDHHMPSHWECCQYTVHW